ncbi:MAG: Gfo/Idh/MocA family oxidoreductase [Anaerolineales bacterium]|nr:Gfo/Idh/MocA family oxidoreductase [Anaerolineales bacterium]
MEQIKIGVIGCGYWGPNLIRNFVEIPTSEVVGVADLREERLEHIKSRYPKIEVTEDYRTLFSMGLDAVVVATPPTTHYPIARDCLAHDLSVLVEKPITLSSLNAEELIGIAEQRGLTLMVGHTFEYNSAVRALKEIIQSGELGEIYYIDAVRVNLGLFQTNLSVLWDLAPHDISILLYLLDRDPISVSAQGMDCLFKGVHDIAYMHLIFPGRVLANVHLSWLDPCKVRRITIVGSRKMVVFDDIEPLEKIKIYDKGVEVPPYTNTYDEFQLSYRYGDVVIPHIKFTEPLRVECNHFVESVMNRTEPQSSGIVGLKVVKVVEAATRSIENGGMQEMTFPEEIQVHEYSVT